MQSDLDEISTVRILIAIVEQAEVDLGSSAKEDRFSALNFFESKAFSVIGRVLGLNEKRVRRAAREKYKSYEQNARNKKSKKHKRQPASEKYQLAEVWGKLRQNL